MMTFTEGNTNRDVPCFWVRDSGVCGMVEWWLCGMEENKKSGGGDVRAEALS